MGIETHACENIRLLQVKTGLSLHRETHTQRICVNTQLKLKERVLIRRRKSLHTNKFCVRIPCFLGRMPHL